MDAPFVRVTGLSKAFPIGRDQVSALVGLDLEVAAATFTAVMGPSGSGKSTLLYLLGGLDRPTSGTIEVARQTITTLNENALAVYRRRTVGFIFQSFNLIPSLTALENVIFPMRFASHIPPRQRQARARELLERVGLADRARHKPTELSGGQQQRVAVARALVHDPPFILADEPTGNLDSRSGQTIMQLLAELHQQGRTVLVVTHDPRMTRFASHLLHLLDGRAVSADEYEAAIAQLAAENPVPGEPSLI